MAENPFEEAPTNPVPPPKPATMRTTGNVPTASVTVTIDSNNKDPALAARAERLRQLEQELNRRENDLDTRTQILLEREKTGKDPRQPNWPRCYPIMYHDIAGDVKDKDLNRYVRMGYANWIALFIMLFYNIVCELAVLIVEGDSLSIGDFVLSIVFFIFLAPLYLFIYKLLYKAGRKETKAYHYMAWLIGYFFQILTHIFFFIGAAGTGAAGFFRMIRAFQAKENTVAFLILAAIIVWGLLAVYSIYLWIMIRIEYYRRKLGQNLKQEATKAGVEVAKNNPEVFVEGAKVGTEAYFKEK